MHHGKASPVTVSWAGVQISILVAPLLVHFSANVLGKPVEDDHDTQAGDPDGVPGQPLALGVSTAGSFSPSLSLSVSLYLSNR